MRVLFCDPMNTQNSFYVLAKYLREAGVDAELVIEAGSKIPEEHLPEWHDKSVATEPPEWVYRIEFPFTMSPQRMLRAWVRLFRRVAQYDLVVCSGIAPAWIRWMRRPFIFLSYGSDLDQMATQGWSGPPRDHVTPLEHVLRWVVKHLVRQAIRKAELVVLSPYQVELASRLRLKKLRFLPHVIDTKMFRPLPHRSLQRERSRMQTELGCDLLLFHPSRQVWRDRSVMDCKGNDKVFRAFASFKESYPRRVKLVVVNKGWDSDASRQLVAELGLTEHVVWIDPVPRAEMVRLYNAADIVLDQFVVGVLALVAVEAMACGTPAVTYTAQALTGMFYSENPPVVNVHSERDLCQELLTLATDQEARDRLGKAGRDWVLSHCSSDVTVNRYRELIEEGYAREH